MAQKKNHNVFDLAPLSRGTRVPTTGRALIPSGASRPLSRRERKSAIERDYQLFIMDGQREKTERGQEYMADLTRSASAIFVETAQEIWGIKISVQDPELQRFIDKFCIEQIKMSGVYLEEATAAGNNVILAEVERTIRIEVEQKQKGFWQSLFGAKDGDDEE